MHIFPDPTSSWHSGQESTLVVKDRGDGEAWSWYDPCSLEVNKLHVCIYASLSVGCCGSECCEQWSGLGLRNIGGWYHVWDWDFCVGETNWSFLDFLVVCICVLFASDTLRAYTCRCANACARSVLIFWRFLGAPRCAIYLWEFWPKIAHALFVLINYYGKIALTLFY